MVGSLQYLILTRLDISYVVHIVSQFLQSPCAPHLIAVKRIFHYLKVPLILDFILLNNHFLFLLVFRTPIGQVLEMAEDQPLVLQFLCVPISNTRVQRNKRPCLVLQLKPNIVLSQSRADMVYSLAEEPWL